MLDCAEDHRRSALNRPAHQMPGAVAMMYLGESLFGRDEFAVRAGGHVAVGQSAGKHLWCGLELAGSGRRRVRDRRLRRWRRNGGRPAAEHGVGVLGVAQVPSAVERGAGPCGKAGRVADVVQPRGGFQQIGVSAENGCQAACPGGDALDVCPAAGEGFLEECPGELLRPRKPACSCGQG